MPHATIAQLLIAGFDGTTLPDHIERALRERRIGGTVLFRRNIEHPEQVAELNEATWRAAGGERPFIAVDQEGGRVQRLREPLTVLPPMRTVASCEDADLVAKLGEAVGDELAALGFNLNFAPCADVDSNPDNPIIGDRAFSADPDIAGRYAGAFAAGLTIAGVIPCAKHFPGHGDTAEDSHLALPTIDASPALLAQRELPPFRALIRARVPMIMTAHIMIPSLDPQHPATLSERILGQLLRVELGYDGVVVSDDLEMKAVADHYEVREMVELGLRAGIDIFLVCRETERWLLVEQALHELWERSSIDRERIARASKRVQTLKEGWIHPWKRPDNLLERLGTDEHRALVARILARATTLS
mgnify:CR=1 FL=1